MSFPAQPSPRANWDAWGAAVTAAATDVADGRLSDVALRAAFVAVAPQFHGVRYNAYGHSFGQVQSPVNVWAGSVYPARLRDLLHADPALFANNTANGSSMTQIATALRASWTGGGGLVSLLGNQNSVGNHEAAATFKAAARSFLSRLLLTAAPPTVLVFKDVTSTSVGYARYGTPPTDADVATYNGYLTGVIAEFPGAPIVVADPLADGWNPATMTAPDGQHPNDAGQAHLTASGLKALAAVPYRAGLNPGYTATPPTATVYDYFDRADSSTTLGSAPSGHAYTVGGSGGVFGISNGEAYKASGTGEDYATVSTSLADVDITVTLAVVVGAGIGPVWRYTDSGNLWTVDCTIGSSAKVYKKVGGGFSQVADLGVIVASGDRVRIVAKGSAGTAYVNGVQAATWTDSFNSSATSHGLRSAESNAFTARMDGLLIKAAP